MSIVISILILLLSGAIIIVALLFSLKILCEAAIEMIALATTQPKKLEHRSSKVATKYINKMNKVEVQIADILEKQRF